MLTNLKLGSKFNFLLIAVFLLGSLLSGTALSAILNRNAEYEITAKALVLLETMKSMRDYTNKQVNPLLAPKLETEREFLPQSSAQYSAREVFEILRTDKTYADFFYKEAMVNPTNLRDQADAFETELIQRFRNQPSMKEIAGFRTFAGGGDLFYIARPTVIVQESCLKCHSTPENAPKSLLNTYGRNNGFGWKLNEVIGAQIVSVPAKDVKNSAFHAFLIVMAAVSGMFAATILLINLLLHKSVISPLNQMATAARSISTGSMEVEVQQTSHDEIGVLAAAFNRMKLSLAIAMNMLDKPK